MTENKVERNMELIRRYLSGDLISELCADFKISKQRVFQILKEAGVPKERHPGRRPGENRDQFLGVNLSEVVKDALRAEAARRGLSMSELSSNMLKDMLQCCGYPMEAEKV